MSCWSPYLRSFVRSFVLLSISCFFFFLFCFFPYGILPFFFSLFEYFPLFSLFTWLKSSKLMIQDRPDRCLSCVQRNNQFNKRSVAVSTLLWLPINQSIFCLWIRELSHVRASCLSVCLFVYLFFFSFCIFVFFLYLFISVFCLSVFSCLNFHFFFFVSFTFYSLLPPLCVCAVSWLTTAQRRSLGQGRPGSERRDGVGRIDPGQHQKVAVPHRNTEPERNGKHDLPLKYIYFPIYCL